MLPTVEGKKFASPLRRDSLHGGAFYMHEVETKGKKETKVFFLFEERPAYNNNKV